jgi:hypothetical protein
MDNQPKTETDFKIAHPQEWLANERSMRKFLTAKRWIELLIVLVFATLLFALSTCHLIEGETVAAILGAMVGYCFEHWREKGKQI